MSGNAAHMAAMRAAAQKKLQQRHAAQPNSKGKGFKAVAKKVAAKKGVNPFAAYQAQQQQQNGNQQQPQNNQQPPAKKSLPPWLQKGK